MKYTIWYLKNAETQDAEWVQFAAFRTRIAARDYCDTCFYDCDIWQIRDVDGVVLENNE